MPASANTSHKKKATESGKKKNQFFCVLENGDGARILSSVSVKTAMSHLKANAGSLIHFTSSLNAAEALQKSLDQKQTVSISEPNSPVPSKVLLTDDGGGKPLAVPVSPTDVTLTDHLATKAASLPDVTKKQSSAGEFLSFFDKAATERAASERAMSKSCAELSIKVSSLQVVEGKVKGVAMVTMVDDRDHGYWCFKPDMLGLLYKSVSQMLELDCLDAMSSFKVLCKRSVESAANVELVCLDKKKAQSLIPSIHGSKVLTYYIVEDSVEAAMTSIDSIVNGLNRINSDDQCKSEWFAGALNYEKFKFTAQFKSATMSDTTFWRLFKSKVTVKHNVPLDSVLAHASVSDVVTDLFLEGNHTHPADWPEYVKSICFASKEVPIGRVRAYRARRHSGDGLTNGEIEKKRRSLKLKDRKSVFLYDESLPKQSQDPDAVPHYVNKTVLHSLWVQCIKYGVIFLDPLKSNNQNDYNSAVNRLYKLVRDEREAEESGLKRFLPFNERYFSSLPYSAQKEYACCHSHDLEMYQLQHLKCSKCLSVSLMKKFSETRGSIGEFVCSECKQKNESFFFEKGCNRLLPVWYDDSGTVQFELPSELRDLRLGEQLLIQRFSCYVPLVHIRNGMMGLKGHCCCFKQEISEVCNSLPRADVNAVKVVKGLRDELGQTSTDVFFVRRNKVMDALKWLKKHHKWYREDPNLVINEDNLSWMNGEDECELRGVHVIEDNSAEGTSHGISSELYDADQSIDEFQYGGTVSDELFGQSSDECDEILTGLRAACSNRATDGNAPSSSNTIKFPSVSAQPQSEFNGLPIFANAYPWLFPGGVGDLDQNNMQEKGYVTKWLKSLILYFDGRFSKDPTFCFYALNFKQRYQNSIGGKFFINGYLTTNKHSDLESLQREVVDKGNTEFIEKLIHYSAKIRGSSSFWRNKRFEVLSWINRMIELGNGPPTLFITLSCAEHFWLDVKRLLQDRFIHLPANERPILVTKSDVMKAIKQYSIVVQEFFIKKVDHWMKTFAKDVLGVKHYFVRFEFTEGRGEIHAHIIAVADNTDVYEAAYKCGDDECKRLGIFVKYAKETLGLTSTHPATDKMGSILKELVIQPEGTLPRASVYLPAHCPCSKRLCDVTDHQRDVIDLMNAVQTHKCGSYCMRSKTGKHRYCRAGCGNEVSTGGCDTPGFELRSEPAIVRESNGTYKLSLERNTTRMVQSSTKLLRLWRANCDVQLIMYRSDPRNPDVFEVSKVTDYVVSYACKGNTTTETEIAAMDALIRSAQTVSGDETDLIKLAKRMLNRTTSTRVISKQECMVESTDLPLTLCSEMIQTISISGSTRVLTAAGDNGKKSLLGAYMSRPTKDEDISFCEYVHKENEHVQPKIFVPHFVGLNNSPTYPVTSSYARSTLIIHIPWRGAHYHRLDNSACIKEFYDRMDHCEFPQSVKLNYLQAKNRYEQSIKKSAEDRDESDSDEDSDIDEDDRFMMTHMTKLNGRNNSESCNDIECLHRGIDYDWSKRVTDFDLELTANFWLENQAQLSCESNNELKLPAKADGSPYNLTEANKEQQEVIAEVLSTIHKWMTKSPDYKPLRMTVSAGAGRGKSYVIHQLTSAIRRIFGRNDVVETAAFTGSAAFNIGGKTCHSLFGISTANPDNDISEATREKLLKQLRYIVAIFIDERSLLSSSILGASERNVAQTCHGGGKQQLDWGGVPIVILWGDDYQLPPVNVGGKGKGAFYCLGYKGNKSVMRRQNVELNGMLQFQSFAKTVYEMNKHQRADNSEFIALQDRIRLGTPTQEDIETLLTLNMHMQTKEMKCIIEQGKGTIQLFATRQPCIDYNMASLINQQSETNPVAMIRNKLPKQAKGSENDLSSIPRTILLCRGAKVCIRGKNFNPKQGLFNGSIGTVVEIVYKPGQSPNKGDFPHYVLVDFPCYTGVSKDSRYPTWIPVPTITTYRPNQTYCPLQLSYGRTIHTFQGFQAGPTQNITRIVCHPGSTKHEGLFPGLFYTALSRATTIGSAQSRSDSAIFFEGLNRDRVDRLTTNSKNKTHALVVMRDKWTTFLSESKRSNDISHNNDTVGRIQRMAAIRYSEQDLDNLITS